MRNIMTAYQRLVAIAYSLVILMNAAMWLSLLLLLDRTQVITILHYNIYFGPDTFGHWYELMILPGVGLAVAVIDFALTTWMWRRDRFLAYVATAGAVATQIVLLISVILMILTNRT